MVNIGILEGIFKSNKIHAGFVMQLDHETEKKYPKG